MIKFAAFDLEIAKVLPEDETDWHAHMPLGISCAAIATGVTGTGFTDGVKVKYYRDVPALSRFQAINLVQEMFALYEQGYQIATWNGTSFDWQVLAQESSRPMDCSLLAMNHIDLMLCVTFQAGHYLGLDKALRGAGLAGKKHEVTLKSGEVITEMNGARAPELWQAGEYEAAIAYLHDDVAELLKLAQWVEANKVIQWNSNRGNLRSVPMPRLYTVRELFELPEPDTSWMTDPPRREQFTAWMGDSA